MSKVVLGLSGGVDSAIAAELLKRDYEVYALYLDIGTPGGLESARRAAEYSKIPFESENIKELLEKNVCLPFEKAYCAGETPNPCVICNPTVKIKALEEYADRIGAEYIATGHYALKKDGAIYRGKDKNDQSYMLCRLTPEQVKKLLLPLGPYEKAEVREMAKNIGLPSAESPDSMEICFIPDKDYAAWLEKRGVHSSKGEFWYHGKCIGYHGGIYRCTVGQHRNLGVSAGKKVYVSKIDPQNNRVVLVDEEELLKSRFRIRDCSWIDLPAERFSAGVRIRHSRLVPAFCEVTLLENDCAEIVCEETVRAPSPGQTAAIYSREGKLLGGGFILPE